MKKRRGSIDELEIPQSKIIDNFKVGDLVTPYYAPHADFYGVVIDINKKEEKVYVDFSGTIRQQDPNEIRVVLKQKLMEMVPQKTVAKVATIIYSSEFDDAVAVAQSLIDSGEYLKAQKHLDIRLGIPVRDWENAIAYMDENDCDLGQALKESGADIE